MNLLTCVGALAGAVSASSGLALVSSVSAPVPVLPLPELASSDFELSVENLLDDWNPPSVADGRGLQNVVVQPWSSSDLPSDIAMRQKTDRRHSQPLNAPDTALLSMCSARHAQQ